jgi:hypothetical protein
VGMARKARADRRAAGAAARLAVIVEFLCRAKGGDPEACFSEVLCTAVVWIVVLVVGFIVPAFVAQALSIATFLVVLVDLFGTHGG